MSPTCSAPLLEDIPYTLLSRILLLPRLSSSSNVSAYKYVGIAKLFLYTIAIGVYMNRKSRKQRGRGRG